MLDDVVKAAYKGCMEIAENPNARNLTRMYCVECSNELTVAYHEDRLYSIHCWRCGRITLVHAADMLSAVEKAGEQNAD